MLSVCDPLCPAVLFQLCLSYTIYLFLWCNFKLSQEIHTQSCLIPSPLSILSPWNNLQECIRLKNISYSCLCDYYLLFLPAEPLSFHSAMFSPSKPSILCQRQHNRLLVASSSSSLMIPVCLTHHTPLWTSLWLSRWSDKENNSCVGCCFNSIVLGEMTSCRVALA